MPIAFDPTSKKAVFLDADGAWKPAQTAVNPQTKQVMAFDGKAWSELPKQTKGVMDYADDVVRSIANGITFGYMDEASAGLNSLFGRGNYESNVAAERARDKQIDPRIAVPGEVTGAIMGTAVALPARIAGAGVEGANLLARSLKAGGVGATYGALYGSGQGENLQDRAVRAGIGGVTGGVLGAAMTPVMEAAAPVVNKVVEGGKYIAQPVINAIRGAVNPDKEAARRVATAISRDIKVDPQAAARLTEAEYNAALQRGEPATVMDMGGGLTRRLADSAAITSPEGDTLLKQSLGDRFAGQAGRITGWLEKNFHYPNASMQREAIKQEARLVNRPAYERAYSEGDKQIWTPELERLSSAPFVKSAIESAISKWKNYAVRDGYGSLNPPFMIENGIIKRQAGKEGNVYPNLQLWDYAARELQDAARSAPPGSQSASLYNDLARSIKKELDTLVPSYKAAREGAFGYFQADNALEAGQNFVRQNFDLGEVRRRLAKMNDLQRRLFQDGFVSRYVEELNRVSDKRTILNKIAESPAAREKLNLVLGPQRSKELETILRVEGMMDLGRQAVTGNSWTTRRLYDLGLAGGAGLTGVGTYNQDPKEITFGIIAGAIASGGKKIDSRVAEKVARLLTSQNTRAFQKGIQIISRNPSYLNAIRNADRRIAGAAGQQGSRIPALQAPAIGRADDQQDVPRPPGQ